MTKKDEVIQHIKSVKMKNKYMDGKRKIIRRIVLP